MESQDIEAAAEEPKKRGPKPKESGEVEALRKQVEQLSLALRMISHFTGTERCLLESGLEKWRPEERHMRKVRG